jgi:hypothetical protein
MCNRRCLATWHRGHGWSGAELVRTARRGPPDQRPAYERSDRARLTPHGSAVFMCECGRIGSTVRLALSGRCSPIARCTAADCVASATGLATLGGTLRIASSPGAGTILTAEVPARCLSERRHRLVGLRATGGRRLAVPPTSEEYRFASWRATSCGARAGSAARRPGRHARPRCETGTRFRRRLLARAPARRTARDRRRRDRRRDAGLTQRGRRRARGNAAPRPAGRRLASAAERPCPAAAAARARRRSRPGGPRAVAGASPWRRKSSSGIPPALSRAASSRASATAHGRSSPPARDTLPPWRLLRRRRP